MLVTLAALVATIAVVGLYQYNRKPATVDGQSGIAVSAPTLVATFEKNDAEANKLYLNKVIDVSGTVTEVSKNQDGKSVLLLRADDEMSGVQCTMRENGVEVPVGKSVSVKGFCNGYTLVVILSDCILN